MLQNRFNLATGSYHRNVGVSLRLDDSFQLAKFLIQHMSIKLSQRIEGLVLG
jgi:hypothetical protein